MQLNITSSHVQISGSSLNIPYLFLNDSGMYQCSVSNGTNSVWAQWAVGVRVPSKEKGGALIVGGGDWASANCHVIHPLCVLTSSQLCVMCRQVQYLLWWYPLGAMLPSPSKSRLILYPVYSGTSMGPLFKPTSFIRPQSLQPIT